MRTFDALWIAYRAEATPTWAYQYKAVIDGQTYTDAEIWTFEKTGGLITDEFGLGNCPIQQLTIAIAEKTGVSIAKNAKTEVFVRITGPDGATSWYSLGVYFIDSRKRLDGGKIELTCLDRMAYADTPYLTDGELLEDYPMAMSAAMTRIYTQLGTTLDARSTISGTMTIDYPNDMTMRQVLGQIASAHGGNFCITEDDKLRLVIPGYGTALAAIGGSNVEKTAALNKPVTYDSVAMIYTENGDYYESGATKLVTLDITNTWATQAITDAVAGIIAGYTYTPYEATGADLDPALELGDHITIDGVSCNLWKWTWNNRLYSNIEIPSKSDDSTSEFGYTGTLTQALAKKVSLGSPYFGATISRTGGLTIAKSDGSSEAVFNSEKLAMRALEEGVMTDKVYFDPVEGKYIFDGLLSADAIEAVTANIDVTVNQTVITENLYATMGTVAELTVDSLETSEKVQRYRASDTTQMDFIRIAGRDIDFIQAPVKMNGATPLITQLTNMDGALLYWTDATETQMFTTVTAWPVYVYEYDEFIKMRLFFDLDTNTGYYIPRMTWGAGSREDYPERGKGYIEKDEDGFKFSYINWNGVEYSITLGETGIMMGGYEGLSALEFFSNGFKATYGGYVLGYRWTKDGSGRITQLEDIHTNEVATVTWGGGVL